MPRLKPEAYIRGMIIYCDESGGVDDEIFLVSAVRDFPKGSDRPIRNIRKILGIKGEVKGHSLEFPSLQIAMNAFAIANESASIAVLRRPDPVHSQILRRHSDPEVWEELIFQAVFLAFDGSENNLSVIVDGGRYTKEKVNEICNRLAIRFSNQLALNRVDVKAADSRNFAGLQLADLAANLAYRLFKRDHANDTIVNRCFVVVNTVEILNAPRLLFERIQPNYL